MEQITMPNISGELIQYSFKEQKSFHASLGAFQSRVAYAASHVVSDPLADVSKGEHPMVDWEATMKYRHYLWSLGFSVAEAMDTAQRGMGLDWETSKELIKRTLSEAKTVGGGVATGVSTDQMKYDHLSNVTLEQIENAYLEQMEYVERHGGKIIMMASRELAAVAQGPDDYKRVYNKILGQVQQPVILHWLGEMFDPSLVGYWGEKNKDKAMDICLEIISENKNKVEGIKLSLLDEAFEIRMRRKLPEGVNLYTGDDFNYPKLILGDEQGYSHALLGIFDAIAPAASAALHALDDNDINKYKQIMEPTVPLSRHIFKAPTFNYKAGIVFLAYLNGHQNHFRMIDGLESARSVIHYSELFRLAHHAGLIRDLELAAYRMRIVLEISGIHSTSVVL